MSNNLKIRDWVESDASELQEMHYQMDVGYTLPTIGPLDFVKKTVTDEDGAVVGIGIVRLVGEAYLFLKTGDEISALVKAKSVKMLHEACSAASSQAGLENVSCWVPPNIETCFSKVLRKLGWQRSRWASWSIALK